MNTKIAGTSVTINRGPVHGVELMGNVALPSRDGQTRVMGAMGLLGGQIGTSVP